jgi:hypothetical protein
MSLAYDPNTILPHDVTMAFNDATLEELEWRLTTAHGLADVLERACRAPEPPRPATIAAVLSLMGQAYLGWALANIRNNRRDLKRNLKSTRDWPWLTCLRERSDAIRHGRMYQDAHNIGSTIKLSAQNELQGLRLAHGKRLALQRIGSQW